MQILILGIIGYLLGSIPFGKIIGNHRGVDIQKEGSGNIGFANVVRVLGWRAGIIVLVGDVAKGILPVYLAKYYFDLPLYGQLIIGLTPILGHAYPAWLHFKGGKSIATGFGVILVLDLKLAIACMLVYLLTFSYFKKSAICSLIGAWSLPCMAFFVQPTLAPYLLLLACFATYTHRVNIKEMLYESAS